MLLFINIGYARDKPRSHIKRQQHPVDRAPDFVSAILTNSRKLRNIFHGEGSEEGAGVTRGLHCCC